jgi:hypothetical protein
MDVPVGDVRECHWWRPLKVAFVGGEHDPLPMATFRARLVESFRDQGHTIVTTDEATIDLLIDSVTIPDGPDPLATRVPERSQPLMLTVTKDYHLSRRPHNLAVLVGVRESLRTWPHVDVVSTARVTMAKIGSPKIVFVSGPEADEVTYCTLEGGHPTETHANVDGLRDRLVTSASAHEVGAQFDVHSDAISEATWNQTTTPDDIVRAGRRMDQLGLLPRPQQISDYVSAPMARVYQRYLGLSGFSEGMLFAVDPLTQTTMVTASGSWDVDKRALSRDEVTALSGVTGGRVQVQAPSGVRPKGPSVEALEVLSLLEVTPRVRLSPDGAGGWRLDPDGETEVPIIRSGIHAHVGVVSADDSVVETIEPDRRNYPYGFGCGTDLMCEVARSTVERSSAINDPRDRRRFVRWPMLYHGEMVIELWKDGSESLTFDGLLDLFDETTGPAINFRSDHIDQPR